MNIVKIAITKVRNAEDTQTSFVYPDAYNKTKISPFIYEDQGNETEHCLALVAEDFQVSTGMEFVSVEEAEALIDSWIDSNKDLTEATPEDIADIKEKKKSWLAS